MTDADLIWTACPIVRSAEVDLVRLVDVDGLGERRPFSFRRTVHWLCESSTAVRLMQGDELLQEICRRNDFYGLMSSPWEALEQTIAYAGRHGIGQGHPLRVDAIVILTERPVIEPPPHMVGGALRPNRRPWLPAPRDWMVAGPETTRWLAAGTWARFEIEPDRLAPSAREILAWSTDRPMAENAAALWPLELIATAAAETRRLAREAKSR